MAEGNFPEGLRLAGKTFYLAIFPFLFDLFTLTGRVLQPSVVYTFRLGVHFTLPFYFPSLTDVYDFPSSAGIQVSTPFSVSLTIAGLAYAVILVAVGAFVAAGYLGLLNASRLGRPSSFFGEASKHFVGILLFTLLWFGVVLAEGLVAVLAVFLGISPVFAVLAAAITIFILGYLLFLAPFAIVVDNLGLSEAVRRSIGLTTSSSSRTLPYAVLYLIITALISIPIYLIMNAGLIGFLLSIGIFSFVGTALVASTFYKYVQITQPPLGQPATSL